MNLNSLLIELLGRTGLPVEQDEYSGKENKYILFVYADETPVQFGNDTVLADTAFLQIQLYTPKEFNYFALKKQIRNLLEGADFLVQSTRSFLGDEYTGTEKIRHTVFEASYTAHRSEED